MIFSRFFTFTSLLAAACAAPFAGPLANELQKRDVVDPKILEPTASTVWVPGESFNVTWDTKDLPPVANITNIIGMVVLAQILPNGNPFLFIDSPLAHGFNITIGSVEITVPTNVTAGNYFIVLFGDSGNDSPTFKIAAASSSTGASSTASFPSSAAQTGPSVTLSSTHPGPSNPLSESPSATSTPSGSLTTTVDSSPLPSTSVSISSTGSISNSSTTSSPSTSESAPATPPASISGSQTSAPAPSGSGNTSGASWLRSNICLTVAAVVLSIAFTA